jgi:hypothetical protein
MFCIRASSDASVFAAIYSLLSCCCCVSVGAGGSDRGARAGGIYTAGRPERFDDCQVWIGRRDRLTLDRRPEKSRRLSAEYYNHCCSAVGSVCVFSLKIPGPGYQGEGGSCREGCGKTKLGADGEYLLLSMHWSEPPCHVVVAGRRIGR